MEFSNQRIGDLASLREALKRDGSVSLDGFVEEGQARRLAEHLETRSDWSEIFRGEDQVYDMPQAAFEALGEHEKAKISELVGAQARNGFQFRFRSIRVPDERAEREPAADLVHAFAEFMCSDESIAFFRALTGNDRIAFADAQATAYSGGHFLTSHDDDVSGKNRVAAYVFSLTENWSPDWGGLLIFPDGQSLKGFLPAFNSLRLFMVPQPHSVTYVPPFVEATRYSITGWLRMPDS